MPLTATEFMAILNEDKSKRQIFAQEMPRIYRNLLDQYIREQSLATAIIYDDDATDRMPALSGGKGKGN